MRRSADTRPPRRSERARASSRPGGRQLRAPQRVKPLDSAPSHRGVDRESIDRVVVVAVCWWVAVSRCGFRAEGEPPTLEVPEALLVGRTGATLPISLADAALGPALALGRARGRRDARTLLAEQYPGNLASGGRAASTPRRWRWTRRRSASWERRAACTSPRATGPGAAGFSGNLTEHELPLTVDLEPPRLSVATGLSYAQRGGSGAVAYSVSEPTAQDGVRVGEHFYRGFPQARRRAGERVALFALPADARPTPSPRSSRATRRATSRSRCWPLVIKERGAADRPA